MFLFFGVNLTKNMKLLLWSKIVFHSCQNSKCMEWGGGGVIANFTVLLPYNAFAVLPCIKSWNWPWFSILCILRYFITSHYLNSIKMATWSMKWYIMETLSIVYIQLISWNIFYGTYYIIEVWIGWEVQ